MSSHLSSALGIAAGANFKSQAAAAAVSLNCLNLALDSWSAIKAPGLEHLVIFITSSRQPIAAATVAVALAMVVHSLQFLLYPFRYTSTEPALSTQTLRAWPLHNLWAAATTISGPASSSADNFRPTFLPSILQPPAFIRLAHGM